MVKHIKVKKRLRRAFRTDREGWSSPSQTVSEANELVRSAAPTTRPSNFLEDKKIRKHDCLRILV